MENQNDSTAALDESTTTTEPSPPETEQHESTDHAPFRQAIDETQKTSVPADAGPEAHVSRLREILDEIYHVSGLQSLVGEMHELVNRLHGPRSA